MKQTDRIEIRDDVVALFLRAVKSACKSGLVNQDALPLIIDSINKGDIVTALKRLEEGRKKRELSVS